MNPKREPEAEARAKCDEPGREAGLVVFPAVRAPVHLNNLLPPSASSSPNAVGSNRS